MKDLGTVYVVTPAYNAEKFVGAAFESLLAQTYPNWKCLCMNDGSTDKTWDVIQEYAKKDSRFIVFSQENKGLTKTLNILLKKVKGPYLAFMDADDYMHPQMLEILLKTLMKTKSDLAECSVVRFSDDVDEKLLSPFKTETLTVNTITDMSCFLTHQTSIAGWINKWNKVYLWDKIKEIRFSEELSYEDDYFYNSLVHSVINQKAAVSIPLYFYRKNPNGACGNVNWEKYQQAGINRIRLSYEYFVEGKRLPQDKKEAFMRDLAQDAYRMIIRKPLKKGKVKNLFKAARQAMFSYLKKGIVDMRYLSPKQRFHVWCITNNFYMLSLFISKLT